jgi:hypothetical protein
MTKLVKKYYSNLIESILDYGISFRPNIHDFSQNLPIIDTSVGNEYFTNILACLSPKDTWEIIFQILSIHLKKKIRTFDDIKRNQLDKNGGLQIHLSNDKILIIHENMDKDKIFQNHDYEDGEPILLVNHTGIKSLGKMKKINFDLWIGQNLERFGGLEVVKGKIIMARNSVDCFDTLKEVDEINLNDGNIKSLGSLEIIHKNCRLGSNLESLGNLKYVGGDILVQSKKIQTLSNLEYVGKRLRIRNTNISDLGNLKTVGDEVLVSRKLPDSLVNQLNLKKFKFKKG